MPDGPSDRQSEQPNFTAFGRAWLERAGADPLRAADPSRIGPYVPVGVLGSGGMGRVYLARPEDDSPGLASVKVIRPEYAEDPGFRRRFEREASVLGRVQGVYAPRLRETGFGADLLWMATDYIPGLSLADAVDEHGPLDLAGLWRLVGDLGQALSALAAAGVMHRDLKPSNVILSADGAHVIDFGISQVADSSVITNTGEVVGSPPYMSPEHIREGRVEAASDVFSLGCTLVYAATGTAPFGNGTGLDVMHRVAFEPPKREVLDEISAADPGLASLLSACLEKEPGRRPVPQELIDAIGARPCASQWPEAVHAQVMARQEVCEKLRRVPTPQTLSSHPKARLAPTAPSPSSQGPAPADPHAATSAPDGDDGLQVGRRARGVVLVAAGALATVALTVGMMTSGHDTRDGDTSPQPLPASPTHTPHTPQEDSAPPSPGGPPADASSNSAANRPSHRGTAGEGRKGDTKGGGPHTPSANTGHAAAGTSDSGGSSHSGSTGDAGGGDGGTSDAGGSHGGGTSKGGGIEAPAGGLVSSGLLGGDDQEEGEGHHKGKDGDDKRGEG